MKTLILTVGLPRSGKSTWARTTGHPIVCPDSIRLALHGQAYIQTAEPFVWVIARAMVRSLFISGHETVILDATNLKRAHRLMWYPEEGVWEDTKQKSFIDVNEGECIRRAKADARHDLIPVIERMAQEPMHEGLEAASRGGFGKPPGA